jgi:hypothetical protein
MQERLLRGLDLDWLIEVVCRRYGVDRGQLAAQDHMPAPPLPTWRSMMTSAPEPNGNLLRSTASQLAKSS